MPLDAGTRLGPYEITGPIGKGGMGEVYRARDTKLDREVAIKVLPQEFANDEERLARFEREAKLLASLNHPNIASIYGFEENALVLELVEGPTLAERIAEGPIQVEEALRIARQIAEALETGHEAGVIHRDLKPANVKVREDGTVKVLDYGLAKALEGDAPTGADSELSQSPTLTRQGTQLGVILGTAAYMSPEQAKGKRVDKRTDIWAFGAVLYEMLTGTRAFGGEDVSETLAAVLRAEPDWDRLPRSTPWRVRDLIVRCLRKDPKRRLRDMGDAALDLEDALSDDEAPQPLPAAPASSGTVVRALTAATLAGVAVWSLMSFARPTRETSLDVKRFVASAGVELPVRAVTRIALSPDSHHIVFEGASQLFLRRLDSFEATPIPGTENGYEPFFSPDGEWVGFYADGQIKKVALSGGPPAMICQCGGSRRIGSGRQIATGVRGADWTTDDRIVFATGGRLYEVPAAGGVPRALSAAEDETGFRHERPRAVPEGDDVLFTAYRADIDRSSVGVYSRSSGESRILMEDGASPTYVSSGHLAYYAAGALHAVPYDIETQEIRGTPKPLIEGVRATAGFSIQMGRLAMYDVSRDGTLVYFAAATGIERQLYWVDRNGAREPASERSGAYQRPRLSRDGSRVAVTLEHGDRARDLWTIDLKRDTLTRFSFDPAHDLAGIWSPDGKTIAFGSTRSGGIDLFAKRSDGTGRIVPLLETDVIEMAGSWSPDGTRLVFMHSADNQNTWDIGFIELEEGGTVEAFTETPFSERHPSVSPDGRWLVYVSDESGRDEVFVRPFPTGEGKWQISSDGGTEPQWARSGREIFYRNGSAMMGVSLSDADAFEAAGPTPLFEDNYRRDHANHLPNYDVAPDGRFLMTQTAEGTTSIHVVLNWGEELKRLVPTNN